MGVHCRVSEQPTTRRFYAMASTTNSWSGERIELMTYWGEGMHILRGGRFDAMSLRLTPDELAKTAEIAEPKPYTSARFGSWARYRQDLERVHAIIDACNWELTEREQRIISALDRYAESGKTTKQRRRQSLALVCAAG